MINHEIRGHPISDKPISIVPVRIPICLAESHARCHRNKFATEIFLWNVQTWLPLPTACTSQKNSQGWKSNRAEHCKHFLGGGSQWIMAQNLVDSSAASRLHLHIWGCLWTFLGLHRFWARVDVPGCVARNQSCPQMRIITRKRNILVNKAVKITHLSYWTTAWPPLEKDIWMKTSVLLARCHQHCPPLRRHRCWILCGSLIWPYGPMATLW